MNSTNNNIKGIIGGFIGIILYFVFKVMFLSNMGEPTFNKSLVQTASELNKICPFMVDRDTRLDNALALPHNVFQYNYTLINILKDSINIPELESNFKIELSNLLINSNIKNLIKLSKEKNLK